MIMKETSAWLKSVVCLNLSCSFKKLLSDKNVFQQEREMKRNVCTLENAGNYSFGNKVSKAYENISCCNYFPMLNFPCNRLKIPQIHVIFTQSNLKFTENSLKFSQNNLKFPQTQSRFTKIHSKLFQIISNTPAMFSINLNKNFDLN